MSRSAQKARIELPDKIARIFAQPRGAVRYRCAYGGRGSGKSYSFSLMAAIFGYAEPLRILCTRELQISIRESMYAEIRNAIQSRDWLAAHYEIGESYIRGRNGTEFLFRGLRHNMSAIKSMSGVDLCIVEEAEDAPEKSLLELEPTIRADRSELWFIWNPREDGSPVDKRFIKNPPDNAAIAEVNYHDNPWLPGVLDKQRRRDREIMDAATYAHVWEGAYLQNSDAQVFHGKFSIRDFTPGADWDGPYFGLDYGFSQDPTAATKWWVHDERLYCEKEAGGVGVELDETAQLILASMSEAETHTMRADNARPESTSYLRRHGLPGVESVKKWQGSIEDGIQFMRGFREIVIHSRCTRTAREFRLYSYKRDRLSGDILPVVIDAENHFIDSARYALEPMIRQPESQTAIFGSYG